MNYKKEKIMKNLNREEFITAMRYIMTLHKEADRMLQKRELPCKSPRYYEFSPVYYSNNCIRFIGITYLMRYIMGSTLWQSIYDKLCQRGLLQRDPEWHNHYRVTEAGMTYPFYHIDEDEVSFLFEPGVIDRRDNYQDDKETNYDKDTYYKSDWWRELREKAIDRAGHKCQMCGKSEYDNYTLQLQVHHLYYKNIYTEQELNDVMCVCPECHKKLDNK